jgi:hypothetical protein
VSGHVLEQKRFINRRILADLEVAEKMKKDFEQKGIYEFSSFLTQ